MRTKQALKNMTASLLLQVVLALSGIIVPRFFTAFYGSSVNGLVSSISQFITYMSLVEAGIGAAGTVALYGPIARKETSEINGIVSAARMFYLRSGLIFVALVVGLVLIYPYAVQNEIQNLTFIRTMILILSVNGIVDYFFLGKYRVLLQADQRGYIISMIQIAGTIVMTVVSVALIELEVSALLVKGVTAIIYLARSLFVALYVKVHYPHVSFREKPNMAAFHQRWAALLHQVVGMIVNNAAVVLLTLFVRTNALVEVSVYSVYNLVGYSLSSLMTSISNGLSSGFGQVISQKEEDTLKRSYSSYEFLYFLLIFLVYSCMAVLLYPFIELYSAAFSDAQVYIRPELVILFTAAGILQSVRLPGLTVICAAGHYKQTQSRAVLEAVINIVVSLILIRPLGLTGVMIGICISYLYRTTDVVIYNAKHFVKGSLKHTIKRLIGNGAVFAVVVFLGCNWIPRHLSGWYSWFGYALVYGIITCIAFVLVNLLLDPKEGKALFARAKELLRKK